MYRPKGFNAEKALRTRKCIPDEATIPQAYIDMVEAGADAMLEGLKKYNAMNRIENGQLLIPDERGYLVFIPKEE